MYDKTKKTWSQRLKITKSEKTAYATTTSVVTTTSKIAQKNAQSINSNEQQQSQTQQQQHQILQIQPFAGSGNNNSPNINYQNMHLAGALQFSDYQNVNVGYTTDYISNATSRSIKYAEPWIYSTVRGIPARPYNHMYQQAMPNYAHHPHPHAAAIFASPPLTATEALAVVICSCPEYLNGTKRDMKKASICKKCKGSRLPLTTIGSAMPAARLRAAANNAAATMRVVSMSKKLRPTILDPQKDPYDMMRRTRLLSPEPNNGAIASSSNSASKDKTRNRGKSASPTRSRGRSRIRRQPPSLRSNTNAAQEHEDCWLIEDNDNAIHSSTYNDDGSMTSSSTKSLTQARRSILRCNLNPYDLISIESNQETSTLANLSKSAIAASNLTPKSGQISKDNLATSSSASSQNEFMVPTDDDFNVNDAALNEDEPPFIISSPSTEGNSNRMKNLNGRGALSICQNSNTRLTTSATTSTLTTLKRIELKNSASVTNTNDAASKLNYTNVQAIAGQRISLGKQKKTEKSLIKQSGDNHFYESIVISGEIEESASSKMKSENVIETKMQQSIKATKTINVQQSHPKRPPRIKKQESNDTSLPIASSIEQNKNESMIMTESTNDMELQNNAEKEKTTITVLNVTPTHNIKSILKRPTSRTSNSGDTTPEITKDSNDATATVSISYKDSSTGNKNTKTTTTTVSINQQQHQHQQQQQHQHQQRATKSPAQTPTLMAATSQFYIPLPQQSRKKVQFMMEDKVIHAVDNTSNSSPVDCEKNQSDWHKANNANDDHERNINGKYYNVAEPSSTHKSATNYEYYNKKRQQGQQEKSTSTIKQTYKMQTNILNDTHANNDESKFSTSTSATASTSSSTTINLQEAVLAKIQLASEKVSKALNTADNEIQRNNDDEIKDDNHNNNNDNVDRTSNKKNLRNIASLRNENVTEMNHAESNVNAYANDNLENMENAIEKDRINVIKNVEENLKKTINYVACDSESLNYEEIIISENPLSSKATAAVSIGNLKKQSLNKTNKYDLKSKVNKEKPSTIVPAENSSLTSTKDENNTSSLSSLLVTTNSKNNNIHDTTDMTLFNDKSLHIKDDYDDVACEKLQAFVATDSSVQTTQSRHPIRRSHSERMPVYNKLTSVGIANDDTARHVKVRQTTKCNNENTSNNNTSNGRVNKNSNTNLNKNLTKNSVLNFKDTTALRLKNNQHKDSRNLFTQNYSAITNTQAIEIAKTTTLVATPTPTTTATSWGRPKEPPPPPPSQLSSSSPSTSSELTNSLAPASPAQRTGDDILPYTTENNETMECLTTTKQVNATANFKENFLSKTPKAQGAQVDINDKKKSFGNAFGSCATKQTTLITALDLKTTTQVEFAESSSTVATKGLQIQKQAENQEDQQQQQLQYAIDSTTKEILHSQNNIQSNNFDNISTLSLQTKGTTTPTSASTPLIITKETSNNFIDNKKDNIQMKNKNGEELQSKKSDIIITKINSENTNSNRNIMPKANLNTKTTSKVYNTDEQKSLKLNLPQRTVVRVAPFNKVNSSEVHRLKINHTDNDHVSPIALKNNENTSMYNNADDDAAYAQKKTSILINGDDCYSTMNLSHDAKTPIYQSSVVVADYSSSTSIASIAATATDNHTLSFNNNSNDNSFTFEGLKMTTTSNTVTINLSSPTTADTEKDNMQQNNNKMNKIRNRQTKPLMGNGYGKAIIPIKAANSKEVGLQRSASSTSSASSSSLGSSSCGSDSGHGHSSSLQKRGRTLIKLDYECVSSATKLTSTENSLVETFDLKHEKCDLVSHEEELLKILRNPVEAVKRNLVPHVCGKNDNNADIRENIRNKKMKETGIVVDIIKPITNKITNSDASPETTLLRPKDNKKITERSSFIAKLLEDAMLSQVANGLETETVAELIENSLKRLRDSRNAIDITGTKDNDDMNRLITLSLRKIQEERQSLTLPNNGNNLHLNVPTKDEDHQSNRGSISSANSFASANNYELFDFDANESDCYQSCSSEITTPGDDDNTNAETRSKFYQMLVDATLAEIELNSNMDNNDDDDDDDEHHYESIRNNGDPIYEEITDVPPPLPISEPPTNDIELEKKTSRSIFEGASKYDILSYLVDAKERGVVREEPFEYTTNCTNPIIIEEEASDTLSDLCKRKQKKENTLRSSNLNDSNEENRSTMSSLSPPPHNYMCGNVSTDHLLRKNPSSNEIERNDSGVGSETSKCSRSKFQCPNGALIPKNSPIHLCEDCDGPVEIQITDSGVMFAPIVCRKCSKKRIERKEIITEIVETEEKYGRDLQIILEEFYHPMLVAGLLTQEQLSAIFLNTEELLENSQTLAERMRDALDIAIEQGDDDFLTVNIGRIFLDFTQMLHAFESYCVRQAGASLLLANLEKEKELLRIFLKVSQMENAVLRRMNLNSFLMVPVQRVTKYPLLLARLYKVTPTHLEGRDLLKQAQEKIELHLNHINQEAKDVPTKLWRRISSSSPNRRASCEIDMINIKLRKMAIDILEWNHDEVRFAMEGKLLYTQPTDSNWKKARSIKLTPVNALLVTNGKPSANYRAEKVMSDKLNFPKHNGIREASLLVMKEKCGRYTLIREPLYLDRCVVCSEADWDDYFEVQEISSKDTFIFKAEDGVRTKQWYTQLQYHAQGMGAWRKRRNALANIMINGMLTRS